MEPFNVDLWKLSFNIASHDNPDPTGVAYVTHDSLGTFTEGGSLWKAHKTKQQSWMGTSYCKIINGFSKKMLYITVVKISVNVINGL